MMIGVSAKRSGPSSDLFIGVGQVAAQLCREVVADGATTGQGVHGGCLAFMEQGGDRSGGWVGDRSMVALRFGDHSVD